MNIRIQKIIAKLLGNFGIAFFSPLVGGNVAETLFELSLTFNPNINHRLLFSNICDWIGDKQGSSRME